MTTSDEPTDPTPEQIEAEFPGWEVFQGINDLWYARYSRSSPQIRVCDENTTELREQVRAKTAERSWS
jgi:hypothetical protein